MKLLWESELLGEQRSETVKRVRIGAIIGLLLVFGSILPGAIQAQARPALRDPSRVWVQKADSGTGNILKDLQDPETNKPFYIMPSGNGKAELGQEMVIEAVTSVQGEEPVSVSWELIGRYSDLIEIVEQTDQRLRMKVVDYDALQRDRPITVKGTAVINGTVYEDSCVFAAVYPRVSAGIVSPIYLEEVRPGVPVTLQLRITNCEIYNQVQWSFYPENSVKILESNETEVVFVPEQEGMIMAVGVVGNREDSSVRSYEVRKELKVYEKES